MRLEYGQVWLPTLPFREPKLTRWICTIKISWVGYRFGEPKTVAEAENLLWVRDRHSRRDASAEMRGGGL